MHTMQITVVMVSGIPESPRWLCKTGKPEQALQVLSAVYDVPLDNPDIVKEHNDILAALGLESAHGEYRWSQIFKRDKVQTSRRILLAYGVSFINQYSSSRFHSLAKFPQADLNTGCVELTCWYITFLPCSKSMSA